VTKKSEDNHFVPKPLWRPNPRSQNSLSKTVFPGGFLTTKKSQLTLASALSNARADEEHEVGFSDHIRSSVDSDLPSFMKCYAGGDYTPSMIVAQHLNRRTQILRRINGQNDYKEEVERQNNDSRNSDSNRKTNLLLDPQMSAADIEYQQNIGKLFQKYQESLQQELKDSKSGKAPTRRALGATIFSPFPDEQGFGSLGEIDGSIESSDEMKQTKAVRHWVDQKRLDQDGDQLAAERRLRRKEREVEMAKLPQTLDPEAEGIHQSPSAASSIVGENDESMEQNAMHLLNRPEPPSPSKKGELHDKVMAAAETTACSPQRDLLKSLQIGDAAGEEEEDIWEVAMHVFVPAHLQQLADSGIRVTEGADKTNASVLRADANLTLQQLISKLAIETQLMANPEDIKLLFPRIKHFHVAMNKWVHVKNEADWREAAHAARTQQGGEMYVLLSTTTDGVSRKLAAASIGRVKSVSNLHSTSFTGEGNTSHLKTAFPAGPHIMPNHWMTRDKEGTEYWDGMRDQWASEHAKALDESELRTEKMYSSRSSPFLHRKGHEADSSSALLNTVLGTIVPKRFADAKESHRAKTQIMALKLEKKLTVTKKRGLSRLQELRGLKDYAYGNSLAIAQQEFGFNDLDIID
jgi:hypothetical protein